MKSFFILLWFWFSLSFSFECEFSASYTLVYDTNVFEREENEGRAVGDIKGDFSSFIMHRHPVHIKHLCMCAYMLNIHHITSRQRQQQEETHIGKLTGNEMCNKKCFYKLFFTIFTNGKDGRMRKRERERENGMCLKRQIWDYKAIKIFYNGLQKETHPGREREMLRFPNPCFVSSSFPHVSHTHFITLSFIPCDLKYEDLSNEKNGREPNYILLVLCLLRSHIWMLKTSYIVTGIWKFFSWTFLRELFCNKNNKIKSFNHSSI